MFIHLLDPSKYYDFAFVLDPSKLTRITEVITRHFDALNREIEIDFTVVLKDRRSIELKSVEEVVKLENNKRNPIVQLTLVVFGIVDDPLHWKEDEAPKRVRERSSICNILFDSMAETPKGAVKLSLKGLDRIAELSLQSELDEQIERTLIKNVMYRIRLYLPASFIAFMAVAVTISILVVLIIGFLSPSRELSPAQIEGFVQLANESTTLEQKVDFLFSVRKAEFEAQLGLNKNSS